MALSQAAPLDAALYLEPYNARLVAHRARVLLADILDRMRPGEDLFGLFRSRRAVVLRGIPAATYRVRDEHERFPRPVFVELLDPAMHETRCDSRTPAGRYPPWTSPWRPEAGSAPCLRRASWRRRTM